jgi:hypothetical protein
MVCFVPCRYEPDANGEMFEFTMHLHDGSTRIVSAFSTDPNV